MYFPLQEIAYLLTKLNELFFTAGQKVMTKEEDEMLSIYHGLKLEYMNHIFFGGGG